jgi:hypothetical protein
MLKVETGLSSDDDVVSLLPLSSPSGRALATATLLGGGRRRAGRVECAIG